MGSVQKTPKNAQKTPHPYLDNHRVYRNGLPLIAIAIYGFYSELFSSGVKTTLEVKRRPKTPKRRHIYSVTTTTHCVMVNPSFYPQCSGLLSKQFLWFTKSHLYVKNMSYHALTLVNVYRLRYVNMVVLHSN